MNQLSTQNVLVESIFCQECPPMCFEAGALMWFLAKLFATHMPYAFCETKIALKHRVKTVYVLGRL